MANEKITIASQRNFNDVATELTMKYMESHTIDYNKVAEIYKVFYKAALEAFNQKF